jgi:hypothetical protein
MNIWPGIISLIESKTAITDLIGNPMRLYPDVVAQGTKTYPALEYSTNVIVGHPTFDGASRIDFNFVRFHAFGQTKSQVENLISTLRNEMEDESGTYNGLQIRDVRYVDSGADDYLDGIEKHTKMIEFQITTLRTL